jgi:hypothetical protein
MHSIDCWFRRSIIGNFSHKHSWKLKLTYLRESESFIVSLIVTKITQKQMTTYHHPSALRNRTFICSKLKQILPSTSSIGNSGNTNNHQPPLVALEVGSGTGAHIDLFSIEFPNIIWQPTEYVPPPLLSEDNQITDIFSAYGKIRPGLDVDQRKVTTSNNTSTIKVNNEPRDELALVNKFGCDIHSNVLPALPLDLTAEYQNWDIHLRNREEQFILIHCGNVLHCSPPLATQGLLIGASHLLKENGWLSIYGPFKRQGKFTTESNAAFDLKLRTANPLFGYRDLDEIILVAKSLQLILIHIFDDVDANNFFAIFQKRTTSSLSSLSLSLIGNSTI